jgi:hypothetical protein
MPLLLRGAIFFVIIFTLRALSPRYDMLYYISLIFHYADYLFHVFDDTTLSYLPDAATLFSPCYAAPPIRHCRDFHSLMPLFSLAASMHDYFRR